MYHCWRYGQVTLLQVYRCLGKWRFLHTECLATLFRDTSCLQHHGIDSRRRKVHGRLFGFGAADDGSKLLLTGQSSHAVAAESIWQSGVRMLSSFGGPNRSQGAPPVMSINSDGTLAVVFQQGGRSMLQMPRENLYDRYESPVLPLL